MFFGDGNQEMRQLNGKIYPHPALVFMIHGRELFVRALAEDCRSNANTRLKSAPYWNTTGAISASFLRTLSLFFVGTVTDYEWALGIYPVDCVNQVSKWVSPSLALLPRTSAFSLTGMS
jgi:Prokaryotic E2 family D